MRAVAAFSPPAEYKKDFLPKITASVKSAAPAAAKIKGEIMKAYIKDSAALLKKNLSGAVVAVCVPLIAAAAVKAAELALFYYFFPKFQSDLKTLLILLFSLILSAVLVYPLNFGKKLSFYARCFHRGGEPSEVFSCYCSVRAFFLSLFTVAVKKLCILLVSAVTMIPCIWWATRLFYANAPSYLLAAALGLSVAAAFICLTVRYSLFLTEYIAAETGKNPFYCLYMSYRRMKRRRTRLFRLRLRFLPLFLLGLLILPLLYTAPLYSQATALFAKDVIFCTPIYPRAASADTETECA